MKRPEIRIDINGGYAALNEYTIRLDKYCDFLEQEKERLIKEVMKLEEELGCS